MYRLPVWGGCGAQVICYGTIPRDLCRAVSPEARTGNRIISGNDKREGVGMLTDFCLGLRAVCLTLYSSAST